MRINGIWLILLVPAALLSLLYLWGTLMPGNIPDEAAKYFTEEQIAQGRAYHRALRLAYIISFLTQGIFLSWLVFDGPASRLYRWSMEAPGGNNWGRALLFSLGLWLFLTLLNLPFSFFRSYYWQQRWGFSTQSLGSWWLDYAKSAGIDVFLFTAGVLLFFWLLGRFPQGWWLLGAGLFSLWLVVQTIIWPVAVSPLFNKFTPAREPWVVEMAQELAAKAELPVDQVLVMDASRRTTQANAYFTGLGRTKRIVLYDTLLQNYEPDEVKAVVAHEMAHWRQGHIVKGISWGILGIFILWGGLFLMLPKASLPGAMPSPSILPAVLLFVMLVSFVSSPVQNYISRGMEREADRVAAHLTGDAASAAGLQINLAVKNLSDVAPAPFIVWFSYSHPPALSRIADFHSIN